METTGLNPEHNKIITIQIQELVGRTGEPIGEIDILKEWESSEKEIIEKVMPLLTCENPFDFIIIGKNLLFDFMFLSKRAEKYGLKGLDLRCVYDRAFTDLKHVLVMINEGNFRGYDKLLKKGKITNEQICQLYEQEKYAEIIKYIQEEAKIFADAYQRLRKEMPSLAKHL
jgi:DNA polymerase elongation subunit (family B)